MSDLRVGGSVFDLFCHQTPSVGTEKMGKMIRTLLHFSTGKKVEDKTVADEMFRGHPLVSCPDFLFTLPCLKIFSQLWASVSLSEVPT